MDGKIEVTDGDWRTQLQPESRQRIVNEIMETLKRNLPFSGEEELQELKKIAEKFEGKIYTAATCQSDYLSKMLTMETKSQNPMSNSVQSDAESNNRNPQDPASQSMQPQMQNQVQQLPIPMVSNQSQVRKQLLSQNNNSAGLASALPTVGGMSQGILPNIPVQNPNMQNMSNMGNSMGQGMPSNMYINSQRQIQGRQQQQQQVVQYLYNQKQLQKQNQKQLQKQNHMKRKFQNMQQQKLMKRKFQKMQQQNLMKRKFQKMQQQPTIGQQNNLPNMHQQQSACQESNLSNMHQQQLGSQTNLSGFQQLQMVGVQNGSSSLQNSRQPAHMLQQSKVAVQQQILQNMTKMMPNQNQSSQPMQQQLMSQIQSQPGQLQQQMGLQQQANTLSRDMQQRIPTSGPMQTQRVPEVPMMADRSSEFIPQPLFEQTNNALSEVADKSTKFIPPRLFDGLRFSCK